MVMIVMTAVRGEGESSLAGQSFARDKSTDSRNEEKNWVHYEK